MKWHWPILGICALQLTHPKCTHTAVNTHTHTLWTHTRSSGQPFMLRRPGSSWGLKVERALDIHSPHLQFLPARDSNSQPLDYESDSLTIRSRLPHDFHSHPWVKDGIRTRYTINMRPTFLQQVNWEIAYIYIALKTTLSYSEYYHQPLTLISAALFVHIINEHYKKKNRLYLANWNIPRIVPYAIVTYRASPKLSASRHKPVRSKHPGNESLVT